MSEQELLKKAGNELSEHFDSVIIFVTRHDANDGGTFRGIETRGNWFARYGQVKEWVIREEETSRINARECEEEE